jgi:hypothetical protein
MEQRNPKNSEGIKKLVEEYRKRFQQPENTDYYSEYDYKKAERKFIKYCLIGKP